MLISSALLAAVVVVVVETVAVTGAVVAVDAVHPEAAPMAPLTL
jgi:hypothetical protein